MVKKKKLLSTKTLVMLVIVLVILVGVGYYIFFYTPTKETQDKYRAEIENLEGQIAEEQAKSTKVQELRTFLDNPENTKSRINSYDNSKNILKELNETFQGADTYNLTFSGSPTQKGTNIERPVSVTFTASNFASMYEMVSRISDSEYRNYITTVSISTSSNDKGLNGTGAASSSMGLVYIETTSGSDCLDDGILQREKNEDIVAEAEEEDDDDDDTLSGLLD